MTYAASDKAASSQANFGSVALMGLGASTCAAAEYLLPLLGGRVSELAIFAPSVPEARKEQVASYVERGARVVEAQQLDADFDLGVMSPGIPQVSDFFASAKAHCTELVSEPELAWRESPELWVGITGTNGKTTTTTLACELIKVGGISARPVGNIGLPPIACVAERGQGEVFVAELSSFQLAQAHNLKPKVGVLLNVTPDHVEWHGTLEEYARAKERLFKNMGEGDLALVGTDDACRLVAARLGERCVRVAQLGVKPADQQPDAAWLNDEGYLCVRLEGCDHVLARFDDMQLKGEHNLQNSLAAAASALVMGASDEDVTAGLLNFHPLAHRIEPCGEVAGVRFFDDSKGTNTDASVKAVESFAPGSLVVLLGGHDKMTDLTELAQACVSHARVAVCYGEAGARLRDALVAAGAQAADEAAEGEGAPAACAVLLAPHMREAFEAAVERAHEGDSVLLSPACSSFDEFCGYVQRGEAFQALVRDLAEKRN